MRDMTSRTTGQKHDQYITALFCRGDRNNYKLKFFLIFNCNTFKRQIYYNQEIKKLDKRINENQSMLALFDKEAESVSEKNMFLNVQRESNECELLKGVYVELQRQIEDMSNFSGESGIWSGEYSDNGKLKRTLQTGYERVKNIQRNVAFEAVKRAEIFKISHDVELESQPWYHGKLLREQACVLLKNEGDFLLRVN
jgi:hypothetical protein